ncbi:MAG: choline ABC transporter permease [Clostridia bacterium BRH_c25]|nr:MAG: choline ABC transporter permease [Clostridia bacterium BRH_c25]
MELFNFFIQRWDSILELALEHIVIVITAMLISIALGIITGVLITYYNKSAKIVLSIAGILMTVPSLALFSLLIPVMGIGKAPAIAGIVIYTQLPIIRNVYIGIMNIDPSIIEAANGMGISPRKIMYKIKLPLAFPVIMAGVRTSVVMGIGIGAIAAYIGAGGLGAYIFHGISRSNDKMIIIGAVLISVLTILADKGLGRLQKHYEI